MTKTVPAGRFHREASTVGTTGASTTKTVGRRPTLLVPLYADVGPVWSRLIEEKVGHPGARIAAIVNPNSGPGSRFEARYSEGVARLTAAGIATYAYVYTRYGKRPLARVEADIDSYTAWYPTNGLFIDNLANVAGHEAYYIALRRYARTRGLTRTIANAGAATLPSYATTANAIIVYEADGWPSRHDLKMQSGAARPAFIARDVPYDAKRIAEKSAGLGFFYVTDRSGRHAYARLPTYIDRLVAAVTR